MSDLAQKKLAAHVAEIRALGKRMIADIIEIGRHLTDAKALCGHGQWLPWLEREFGWKESTALNFMRVSEMSKSANFTDLGVPVSSLYLLAAPSTPEAARDEVFTRARSGPISHKQIKQIIGDRKPAKPMQRDAKPAPPTCPPSAIDDFDDVHRQIEALRQRSIEAAWKILATPVAMERDAVARHLAQLRKVVDLAAAWHTFFGRTGDKESEQQAHTLRWRAAREGGRLLIDSEVAGIRYVRSPKGVRIGVVPPTMFKLEECGLTKKESDLWQSVAGMPSKKLDDLLSRGLSPEGQWITSSRKDDGKLAGGDQGCNPEVAESSSPLSPNYELALPLDKLSA